MNPIFEKLCNKSDKIISRYADSTKYCLPNHPFNKFDWISPAKPSHQYAPTVEKIRPEYEPAFGESENSCFRQMDTTTKTMTSVSVCLSKQFLPFLRTPLLFFRLNESNKTTDFAVVLCEIAARTMNWVHFSGSEIKLFSLRLLLYSVSCTWTTMSLCGCWVTFCFTMQRWDSVVRAYAISSTRLYANKTVLFFPFRRFPILCGNAQVSKL